MKGTVAIHLKSESCDSYLHLFEGASVEEIGVFLRSEMEMFEPLADYDILTSNKDFETEISKLMQKISDESWSRCK